MKIATEVISVEVVANYCLCAVTTCLCGVWCAIFAKIYPFSFLWFQPLKMAHTDEEEQWRPDDSADGEELICAVI